MCGKKIFVTPDPDLAEEAEWYMGQLKTYSANITEALARKDFESLRTMGHRMKGSGVSFGFDGASKIGQALEEAAGNGDATEVQTAAEKLADYVQRVELA